MNFHRSQLLTESDKRKYRELFAKLISNNETSLPALSSIQSKTKVIKGPAMNQFPINMPTNLNPLIAQDVLNHQNEAATTAAASSNSANDTNANSATWVHCNEVPITFRQQLPSLPHSRTTKANLARQVTNVIKRHNGQQQLTDKII